MNVKERHKVVLAALLHDIGKFWERADLNYSESEIIKSTFPNNEFGHVVPLYPNGEPMYRHALWTQAFLNKYELGKSLGLDTEDCFLANLSSRHHRPSNHLEGIISIADKWSSSIDRPDEGEEDVSGYKIIKDKWGTGFSKKVPLTSIFDKIAVKDLKSEKDHYFSLNPLNVMDAATIYPNEIVVDKNSSLEQRYMDLWILFEKEFTALCKRCTEFDSFYISLNDLLRKYTWCIPSATNIEPANVSLYEHLKTTAGIAISLYDYYSENKKEIEYSANKILANINDEESLLMVCIDIAGIQKFIYDIANKKAAKSLKGRSFFLQLLMQSILDLIMNHKDIMTYPTNVIYASGGKAYLILPNLDKVKKGLDEVNTKVQNMLWEEYGGKIYVVFGHISFCYETFKDSNTNNWTNKIKSDDISEREYSIIGKSKEFSLDLGDLWRLVSDRAASKKHQKFLSKVLAYDDLFTPKAYALDSIKCAVTGEREIKDNMVNLEEKDDEKQLFVLKNVDSQIKLGQSLKNGNYLVSNYGSDEYVVEHDIKIFDTLYEVKGNEILKKLPSSKFAKTHVQVFNETNFSELNGLNNIGISTLFYGGNKQPMVGLKPKTFEDLALNNKGENTKLAILRMDVDNLGQIFINGFDEKVQKKSFAGYATLSFMLEAFFCGHINQIQQSNDLFKDFVQILYSGGDDLFAVGRWDAIIEFAAKVRTEFDRFAGRDDISISGGITIVGAKYPISKSAELAGDAEKAAKAFNDKRKNAINFFGETVSWKDEFGFVRGTKDSFLYFDGIVSRALIQQVQQYKILKDEGIREKNIDLSYKWHSAYSITRTLDRIKESENKPAWDFVNSIRQNMLHNPKFGADRYLDLLALGARWAEYEIRFNNKKI